MYSFSMTVLVPAAATALQPHTGYRWMPESVAEMVAFQNLYCVACVGADPEVMPDGCGILSDDGGLDGFWRVRPDGQPECKGFVCRRGLQQ